MSGSLDLMSEPGDRAEAEARWRRIDALLQRGYMDPQAAIQALTEADLVRKALGAAANDGHLLWILEASRGRRLVSGPRLLLARESGRGYGAIGGRLYRPIDDALLYDQGLFSVEFPGRRYGDD